MPAVAGFEKHSRFWRWTLISVLLLFCLRLVGITNIPAEATHSWRQATGNMVARNFYNEGADLLKPKHDNAGSLTGITGMELPVFNYLICQVANLTGTFKSWYGRLVNLVFTSIGVWFFFLLVRKYTSIGEKGAFLATVLLNSSLWFMFARKVMPDTFSAALAIIGLYLLLEYLYGHRKWGMLLLGSLILWTGILSKIPAGLYAVLLVLPMLDKKVPLQRKIAVVACSLPLAAFCGWWYFIEVPRLVKVYGIYQAYMGVPLAKGWANLWANPSQVASRFYFEALRYTGFAAVLAGVYALFRRGSFPERAGLALLAAAFFFFMVKSGHAFRVHNYYMLPFVPAMALLAARGILLLPKIWMHYAVLAIVVVENIANAQHDFFLREEHRYRAQLEEISDRFSTRQDLVVFNTGDDPTDIYFSNRRGWVLDPAWAIPIKLQDLKKEGAKFFYQNKRIPIVAPMPDEFVKVHEDDYYIVYRL